MLLYIKIHKRYRENICFVVCLPCSPTVIAFMCFTNLATCKSNHFKRYCSTHYSNLGKERFNEKKYKNYWYVYIYLLYIHNYIFCRILLALVYYYNIDPIKAQIIPVIKPITPATNATFQSLDDNLFSANSRFKDSVCKSALSSFI